MTDFDDNYIAGKIPKKPGLFEDVPPGYFENLPDNLLVRKHEMRNAEMRYRHIVPIAGLAATLLLIICIGALALLNLNGKNGQLITEKVEADSVVVVPHELMVLQPEPDSQHKADQVDVSTTASPATQDNTYEDLMMLLDAVPSEVIIEYLSELEEFEF